MRKFWKYIQAFLLLGLIALLFSFSGQRNANRKAGELRIDFVKGQDLFITKNDIKTLIEKEIGKENKTVPAEMLHVLEQKLDSNPMIEKAEVYKSITNNLSVEVIQRHPIARVVGNPNYYIDLKGEKMPLSANHSARVPLISGIAEKDIPELFPLLKRLRNDDFLNKNIVGVHKRNNGDYLMNLRNNTVKVNLGPVSDLDRKIENFKVFYAKAHEDSIFNNYEQINLKFVNQVVGVKRKLN